MAMTRADEERIISALRRMDDAARERVLSTWASFQNWLWRSFRWLWEKFTETVLNSLWHWLTGW